MDSSDQPSLTLIGYLVWWDAEDFIVKQDLFTKILKDVYPAMDINIKDAIDTRMVLQIIREINDGKNDLLIKKLSKKRGVYTFLLMDTSTSRTRLNSSEYRPDVEMSVSSDSISCKEKHRAFDLIQTKLGRSKDMIGSDTIDLLLVDLINKCSQITLCEKKKIFFVENDDNLSKIVDLIEALNRNTALSDDTDDIKEIKVTLLPQSQSSLLEIYNTFKTNLHKELVVLSDIQTANDTLSDKILLDTLKKIRKLAKIPQIFCTSKLDTLNQTLKNDINAIKEGIENKFLDNN
jgi:hypothetical protein